MTAAIGAEAAAGAAGAEGATAAGATRAAPQAAPTASAPVGSAPASAGSPGAKTRSRSQLRPKKATGTPQQRGPAGGKKPAKSQGPALLGDSGKTKRASGTGGRMFRGTEGKARRLLVGEFLLCLVIIAFSPLTDRHKTEAPTSSMKRLTAVSALFLLLALLSTAGRGAARVASAFGGLVTVALLVSDRDVFTVIAQRFGAPPADGPAGPSGDGAAPPLEGPGVGGLVPPASRPGVGVGHP